MKLTRLTNAVRNGMISGNYIFRACPERTKAMTGTVRAVHKRREGAAGVSSHEAAPNARPGAALLNRRLGRDGFPSVSGAMSARARPAKLGGTTYSWRSFNSLFFRVITRTKNCSADTNHRATCRNGGFHIVRHSQRERVDMRVARFQSGKCYSHLACNFKLPYIF